MSIIKKIIIAVLAVLLCGVCVSSVVLISKDLAETSSGSNVYVENVEFDTEVIYFNMIN